MHKTCILFVLHLKLRSTRDKLSKSIGIRKSFLRRLPMEVLFQPARVVPCNIVLEGLEQALEAVALGGKTVGYLRFFLTVFFRSPRTSSFLGRHSPFSGIRTFLLGLSAFHCRGATRTSRFPPRTSLA